MSIDSAAIWLATRNKKSFAEARDKGVGVDLFNGPGKEAWKFILEYQEKHGDLPGPTLITETSGLPVTPLDLENDPVTLGYVVDQLYDRKVFKALNYGMSKTHEALEQGNQDQAVHEVLRLAEFLRREKGQQIQLRTLAQIAPEVLKQYEATKAGEIGIPYPWTTMTQMTMGMWPGTLTFFVARPGVGKTWTACIIALHVWSLGKRVLVVEPEMSRVELGERLVAKEAALPYGDLVSGQLGMFLEKTLRKKCDDLASGTGDGFYVLDDEERLNSEGIEAAVESVEPDLLVIDSIYMLKVSEGKVQKGPGSRGGRYDRILDTVDWMRSLSRRKKIPILGISQLSRDGKVSKAQMAQVKAGKGTGGLENALAMTDTILWDVHNLFAVWQDSDMRRDKQLLFVPLKARRQANTTGLVIRWDMEEMDFGELGTKVDTNEDFEDDEFESFY